MNSKKLFWKDFIVGETKEIGTKVFKKEEIIKFKNKGIDPSPTISSPAQIKIPKNSKQMLNCSFFPKKIFIFLIILSNF